MKFLNQNEMHGMLEGSDVVAIVKEQNTGHLLAVAIKNFFQGRNEILILYSHPQYEVRVKGASKKIIEQMRYFAAGHMYRTTEQG